MTIPATQVNAMNGANRLAQAIMLATQTAQAIKAKCVAGSIGLHDLVSSNLQSLINAKSDIDSLSIVTGVENAYATLYPHKTFDFTTDVAAVSAGIQTLAVYIVTQIPMNGDYLNTLEFDGSYKLVQRVVTGATPLTNLQAQAQLLLDLVDASLWLLLYNLWAARMLVHL